MFPKEAETVSVPAIAFDKHRMLEEDMDSFRRERGDSFIDMMKNSVPSVARIPSPKPHRKHHHHHHHHHKSKSPVITRKDNLLRPSSVHESTFLMVDNETSTRARSFSDSNLSVRSEKKKVEQTSSVSPQLRRAMYTRHKNSMEDDEDENEGGIFLVIDDKKTIDTTISRDIIGDSLNQTDSTDGETITRRKEELINQVQIHNNKLCKKRTLKMIDQLLEQCSDNSRTVENDIEFEFTRLHVALENRKKELIEEARNIRDKKIEGLKKSKKKCLKSTSVLAVSSHSSVNSSDNDSENGTASSSRRNSGEQDECLQLNGILEPWKLSCPVEENHVDSHLGEVAKKLSDAGQIFSDQLEEGNISFKFNEESMEMFSSIGQLNCNLSSAQFSFAKGLQHGIALAGETVRFEVHTRNISDEVSFNTRDDIKCQIYNFGGESIEVSNHVSLHRSLSNGRVVTPSSPHTVLHKFYCYVFTPQEPGKYEIRIAINDVEIKSSPFLFSVYPKVNLTFDVKYPEERVDMSVVDRNDVGNTLQQRRKALSRRQSSEDSDWADHNWIVQKGDKSTLLRSVKDVPSYIYASPSVKGFCAWKLRVTSACESIVLSVGVGTHSGIPDIDEHFSCDFEVCPNDKKTNLMSARMQVRRTSSFTRISMTYDVLLSTEEGLVRVMCEQNEQDKTVRINPKLTEQFELYPFVSMVHRHDACGRQVCPRPQITLL